MSDRHARKRLRHAHRQLTRHYHALLTLELEGLVALTVHSVTDSLTLPLDADTRDELVELLLMALGRRQHFLQAEAMRMRENQRPARPSPRTAHPARPRSCPIRRLRPFPSSLPTRILGCPGVPVPTPTPR